MIDVENIVADFFGHFPGSDIRLPVLIFGILFLLYIIGRQPLIKVVTGIIRGTAYLFMMAIITFLIKYYPDEIMDYARDIWKDITNLF